MSATIQQFQNDLICVKLYEVRMFDRLKVLRELVGKYTRTAKIRKFDMDWLSSNQFIKGKLSVIPAVTLNSRGQKYLEILETARGDREGSMYFNSTYADKVTEDSMYGYPLFSECSLYEDVTHSTPGAKLGQYLNPNNTPFDGTWVSFDGVVHIRK